MTSADTFAPHMEAVARLVLGEPNQSLSSQNKIRFGSHGSISVDCDRGVWFDHENGVGGGVLDLLKAKQGLSNGRALDWLREHGVSADDRGPDKPMHRQPGQSRRVVASYVYETADGTPYLRVQRTDPKGFWQQHWTGRSWAKGKPSGPDLPYRLPQVSKGDPATPVIVAEGEKDADNITRLGFTATTNAGGASNWTVDHSRWLAGRIVHILTDNDEAGESHGRTVAESLKGIAREIRVIRLPGLGPKQDVTDWIEAGGTAERLKDLCAATPVYGQDLTITSGGSTHSEAADRSDNSSPDKYLAALNDRYCVVRDGGKTRVLTFEPHRQKDHVREIATYLGFEDFRNFYLNNTVRIGEDKKTPLGHWWLKHPKRRQYEGVTFQPGEGQEVYGRLNLWRGWGISPKSGRWPRLRDHIEQVLADGDDRAADYIIRWVAWAFQHPAERAQAALIFKGKKGTGKGTLGNALCQIFGQHGTHISSAEHLAGRFNGHLRDACLLFADEAYWPGDKGAEGSLKRLVTEPDLFIEAKGRDGITVTNMLHIIMASNEDWIVPAGEDERRYAVFNVSDEHMQDDEWFTPLYAEMKAGGLAAMLHDLLAFDLGDWHPRQIPKTAGLLEQQAQSLRPEDAWWIQLLESGRLWGADDRKPNCAVSNAYEEEASGPYGASRIVTRKGLYDQARESSPRLKSSSDHLLGAYLKKHGCSNTRKVMRRQGWEFPPLMELRAEWERRYPGWKWNDPNLDEWHVEK